MKVTDKCLCFALVNWNLDSFCVQQTNAHYYNLTTSAWFRCQLSGESSFHISGSDWSLKFHVWTVHSFPRRLTLCVFYVIYAQILSLILPLILPSCEHPSDSTGRNTWPSSNHPLKPLISQLLYCSGYSFSARFTCKHQYLLKGQWIKLGANQTFTPTSCRKYIRHTSKIKYKYSAKEGGGCRYVAIRAWNMNGGHIGQP